MKEVNLTHDTRHVHAYATIVIHKDGLQDNVELHLAGLQ